MKSTKSFLFKSIILSTLVLLTFTEIYAQQSSFVFKNKDTYKMNYLLYLPADYSKTSENGVPLLLFLHGGGECGQDIELVKRHGPPKLINEGMDFPFVVLSPQNPFPDKLWDEWTVKELLDKIIKKYNIDENRIYLTGMSRGGYGAWRMAIQYPGTFAAIAPVCGAAVASYAGWIKDIPCWVFHGVKDPVISISESENMILALKEAGSDVKFTFYPEAGHDAWTRTYNNPELYKWFLQHTNKQ